jgi:hypothetical protein
MPKYDEDAAMVRVYVRVPASALAELEAYATKAGLYKTYFLSAALVAGGRYLAEVLFPGSPTYAGVTRLDVMPTPVDTNAPMPADDVTSPRSVRVRRVVRSLAQTALKHESLGGVPIEGMPVRRPYHTDRVYLSRAKEWALKHGARVEDVLGHGVKLEDVFPDGNPDGDPSDQGL